jgi:hypothetical protein
VLTDRSLIWLPPERLYQSPQIQTWMLAANHWTEHGFPDGGVGEGTKGAVGVCSPMGGGHNSVNRPDPRAPRDWTTNQRVPMKGPMALASYVAEDGLVGHQWEEQPLGLRGFDAPV